MKQNNHNKHNNLKLNPTKSGVCEYWDKNSIYYDTAPGYSGDDEKLIWKGLLSEAIGVPPKKVLDAGAGTGYISVLLAELGYSVTGVDFSKGMMQFAKQKIAENDLDIDIRVGDVENLEFKDGLFDGVTARYVLWTLPDPARALKEWVRVVRPGGKIVVIDGIWSSDKILYKISQANYSIYRYLKFGKKPFQDYNKSVVSGLPNPKGIELNSILECFSKAGLVDLTVRKLDVIRRVQRFEFPWYMKYANDYPTFMVVGTVPQNKENISDSHSEYIKKEITKRWDFSSANFDTYHGHGIKSKEEENAWKTFFSALIEGKNKKVLDVGCGTGEISFVLGSVGQQVTGIDLSEKMLSVSESKLKLKKDLSQNINFVLGDAENPSFSEDTFDAIVTRHVLWTLPNPETALLNWKKILKPGGIIIVIDGIWDDKKVETKIRKKIGNYLIAIQEDQSIIKDFYSSELISALPNVSGVPVKQGISYMKKAGLDEIKVISLEKMVDIQRKYMPFRYKISYNYDYYAICGKKT